MGEPAADNSDDDSTEIDVLQGQKLVAHEVFATGVEQLAQRRDEAIRALDARIREIYVERTELRVLVRWTQGPALTTYHSATHPCGRVTGRSRSRDSFREEGERAAKSKGLARCSACNWAQASWARGS